MKKKLAIPVLSFILLCGALVLCIVLLLCWNIWTGRDLSAAQEELAVLRSTKDQTVLQEQLDAAERRNAELEEQVRGYQTEENGQLLDDVQTFITAYYSRSYKLYDSQAFFDDLYADMKALCTDKGYEYFCPMQDFSWIEEPLGTDVSEAEPVYTENYQITSSAANIHVYTSSLSSAEVNVLAVFDYRSASTGARDTNVETARLLNLKMIFDAEKNRWLVDDVFTDITTAGIDAGKLK